jgi:hypothetical protein
MNFPFIFNGLTVSDEKVDDSKGGVVMWQEGKDQGLKSGVLFSRKPRMKHFSFT